MHDVDVLGTLDRKIAPGNAALIVVDVQNDFCSDEGVFAKAGNDVSMVREMLPNLRRLIDGARAVGVQVIFVQAIYDPVYLPAPWYERNARLNFEVPRCVSGTWGADFYGVAPQQGETVVRKHRYSAFVNTELDLILRSRQIRTVITTGVAARILPHGDFGTSAFNASGIFTSAMSAPRSDTLMRGVASGRAYSTASARNR